MHIQQRNKYSEKENASVAVLEWPDQPPVGRIQTSIIEQETTRLALAGFSFNSEIPSEPANWQQLRGSYAICRATREGVVIARDMVGCQSLYYGLVQDSAGQKRWIFASEPKAISGLPGFNKSLNLSAIAQYLAFSDAI